MKKILAILLALSLSTILLAGCGESSSETGSEIPSEAVSEGPVASEAFTSANGSEMNTSTNEENAETTYARAINISLRDYKDQVSVLVTIAVDGVTQIHAYVDTSIGTFTTTIYGRGTQEVTVSIDEVLISSIDIEFS